MATRSGEARCEIVRACADEKELNCYSKGRAAMKSLAKAAAGAISLLVVSYATAMGEPATWIGADAFSMGALLVDIKPGGPADRAGLKPGDFIYRFDNKGVPSMAA